ncbi:MAG TPA: hypothetical protein VNQ55_06005 [Parapedobacter sp.]|nr:hypothetical protein [Parapedobacter sp.]
MRKIRLAFIAVVCLLCGMPSIRPVSVNDGEAGATDYCKNSNLYQKGGMDYLKI